MLGKFLHLMERERRDFCFGDLDLARVAEAVSLAAIEPGMQDAAFREKHSSFTTIVGIEGQCGINATSIASTAGIPRETIRRKLKQLQSLGFIVEKERARYVVQPGILQQSERQEAFARGIRMTIAFMNECLDQGLVRWEPPRTTPRPRRSGDRR
jgi:hypothetical protein